MPARRRAVAIAGLALVTLLALFLLALGTRADGTRVVREAPLAFNLRYPDSMIERPPGEGEWLRLEREGLDSFVVMPLRLPAYKGDVGGVLPVVAARELAALRERFPELEPVEEGKARINQVAGYSLVFRISRRPREYGRLVLLPQPLPGARDGVKLLLIANPDAGVGKARDVGAEGDLKTPYRSFRFGTEGP
jgi:hypothetical protein